MLSSLHQPETSCVREKPGPSICSPATQPDFPGIFCQLSFLSHCFLLPTYGLVHILATLLSLLLMVLCLPPSLSFLSHERILRGGFIPSVISSTSHHSSTSVIRVAAGSFKLHQEITNTHLFYSMYFCFKANK